MAVQRFKVPLNNAVFPLVSTKAPRAVFIPQLDSAPRLARGFVGSEDSVDQNVAQIIYGENFMPVSSGVRSVGYQQIIAPTVNTDFDSIFPLRDAAEKTVLYSPSRGKNYVYNGTAGLWASDLSADIWAPLVFRASSIPANSKVTYAYVDGKTFVCYSRLCSTGLSAPVVTAPSTATTGGTLAAGTYYYQVTALLGLGESLPSAEVSRVTVGTTSTVTFTWPAIPGATGYQVYGRTAGGAKQLLATLGTVLTYTDTGAAVPLAGTGLPTDNSAGTDMSIMEWDSATKTLIPATPVLANIPFVPGEIDGISASNGFLLIWSGLSVAWANFNGSQFNYISYLNGNFTGSGSQIPEDVKGNITAILPLPGGFLIFTTRNAVSANYYAQSIASPWVFREIANAGGLESYEQATLEGNLGDVIAYTTAGLQKISLNSAEPLYPALSDFIAGRRTERYDFATHSLIRGGTSVDFFTKVTAVSSRYVVLSYGFFPGVYSYAIVVDLFLKRMGKLRIVHKDCFYYTQEQLPVGLTYSMMLDVQYSDLMLTEYSKVTGAGEGVTAAQHSLSFLLATGEVRTAIWSDDARTEDDPAVVIIGRVQLTRSSNAQFNRVEAEGLEAGNVFVTPSYNGRDLDATIPLIDIERTASYLCAGEMIDCKNFNLVVEGSFDLSTIILEATTSGKV